MSFAMLLLPSTVRLFGPKNPNKTVNRPVHPL